MVGERVRDLGDEARWRGWPGHGHSVPRGGGKSAWAETEAGEMRSSDLWGFSSREQRAVLHT